MLLAESEQPDVIGFSVINANRHCAIDAANVLKQINKDIKIVFGGPAPTFEPYYFFRTCPALDYIVKGEGEETFAELVSCLGTDTKKMSDIRQIKGLIFREPCHTLESSDSVQAKTTTSDKPESPAIVENPLRPMISDLDRLPHPAKYFDFQHISLSRGCPGRCTFCGSPDFWGKGKVRFHSAKWFVDEMELLNRRGVSHFFVSDDTFTMKKNLVIEVCQEIVHRFVDRGLKITWAAISRVDFIDEEMLLHMRKAGCIQISFGVESGSEKIRRTLGKPFKNETIIRAFRLTASFGILPRAYFIYGSPGETNESIAKSIELMEQLKPLSMVSYMLVLFPGTALYKNLFSLASTLKPNKVELISEEKEEEAKMSIWDQKIEDIPWFELDPDLDFEMVKGFGAALRNSFYSNVHRFALDVRLVENKELYPYHADFLSRLAMTFSHGDYASNPKVQNQDGTAATLYKQALSYAPDSRAYLGLAMLMQKQKNFQEAVSIIEQAFEKINYSKDCSVTENSEAQSTYHDDQSTNHDLQSTDHDAQSTDRDARSGIANCHNQTVKRQLVLCMAISLMNMGRFKEALTHLEPFGNDQDIKPYMTACLSRV
ncbi:MAG: radical SAM protein, partial [Desulfamplus sp.]|nr:radical SAM protein [Desulfamplus sp.]